MRPYSFTLYPIMKEAHWVVKNALEVLFFSLVLWCCFHCISKEQNFWTYRDIHFWASATNLFESGIYFLVTDI